MNNKNVKIIAIAVSIVLLICIVVAGFTMCGGDNGNTNSNSGNSQTPSGGYDNEETALVIMSQELDEVFNPFFSTSAADGSVVGMTQISMLTSDNKGEVAFGDDEATVAKDYEAKYNPETKKTTYTFVLKNDVYFADGKPLTIRDVLFNMYVYLDPNYIGSSTMYSTDIVGLKDYRTNRLNASDSDLVEIENNAAGEAQNRRANLVNAIDSIAKGSPSATIKEDGMRSQLKTYSEEIQEDFERSLKFFKEELKTDYTSAIGSYRDEPYNFTTDVEAFMMNMGYVEWDDDEKKVENWGYSHDTITTEEQAIDMVYNDFVTAAKYTEVLKYWATAGELLTIFTAEAKEKLLAEGDKIIENITGIKVITDNTITVNDTEYKVSKTTNEDHSVANEDEYQVLQIDIHEKDPKAVWNFAFTVAPMHYYSTPELTNAFSIPDNKFGVEKGSMQFMTETLKEGEKLSVPLGAGAYRASDRQGSVMPKGSDFLNNNIVYFERNDHFVLGPAKIKKVRYQVVADEQAIEVVNNGAVHFATPQATNENMTLLEQYKNNVSQQTNKQMGYGYIGINAGKVDNINIRKAIMASMDTSLTLEYYSGGLAETIYWSMSKNSWAYPTLPGTTTQDNSPALWQYQNTKDATPAQKDAAAKIMIEEYMADAGVETIDGKAMLNGAQLKYTFTIAGGSLTQHPTYLVFKKSAELLNELGWDITVEQDNNALIKLASGALTVWAAAWGSGIDPDMYQVYHKDSTATSTYNWGYREIKANTSKYAEEWDIILELSSIIDEARTVLEQDARSIYYADALSLVRDLAVELPTYQRSDLYIYNKNIIDASTLDKDTSAYSSPIGKIWEVSLVQAD